MLTAITEPDSSSSNRTVLLGKRQLDVDSSQNGASHSPAKKPVLDRIGKFGLTTEVLIPHNTLKTQ